MNRRPLQVRGFGLTMVLMPCPATDVRAGVVRGRCHQQIGGAELTVPARAIADDPVGLAPLPLRLAV